MRIASLLVLLVAGTVTASAQEGVVAPAVRDGLAIGAVLTPALNGSDPWLLTGVRVSIPIGSRAGMDLESGRIFGGVSSFGTFRSYAGIQFRRLRAERSAAGNSRYLIFGLHYLPEDDTGRFGQPAGRKHHVLGVLGYGGDVQLRNGLRIATDVGLSAGSGLMCFATVTVQWRPGRSDESAN